MSRQRTRTHVGLAREMAKRDGCRCRKPFPKVVRVDAEEGLVEMRHEKSCFLVLAQQGE